MFRPVSLFIFLVGWGAVANLFAQSSPKPGGVSPLSPRFARVALAALAGALLHGRRLVRTQRSPAGRCIAATRQCELLASLKRPGVWPTFLRAAGRQAKLPIGRIPRPRNDLARGSLDACCSTGIEINGIRDPGRLDLHGLTDNF